MAPFIVKGSQMLWCKEEWIFFRVCMYVLLRWNRDLFQSNQQYHTTIKTECPEKLDQGVIVFLGSWGFQKKHDMYSNTETSILFCIQGVLIVTCPHWELLCFYNLSIWTLGWIMNDLQRTSLLFNPGPLAGLWSSYYSHCQQTAVSLHSPWWSY